MVLKLDDFDQMELLKQGHSLQFASQAFCGTILNCHVFDVQNEQLVKRVVINVQYLAEVILSELDVYVLEHQPLAVINIRLQELADEVEGVQLRIGQDQLRCVVIDKAFITSL